jgi:glycerol-3-phosphate acyltransferase PlsY
MNYFLSLLLGYGLGSLSPAALLSKLKQQDLRKQGTHNLGASNTMLVMGKKWGALVMLFDIFKGFFSVKLAKCLFPQLFAAELVAGLGAVLGHIFPFYLGFRGGKGLAAFGGLVLGYDPVLFCILLILGLVLMLIFNCSVAMPMSAAPLFAIVSGIRSQSLVVFCLTALSSILIIVKHWSNIEKGRSGKDLNIREFVRNGFSTTGKN